METEKLNQAELAEAIALYGQIKENRRREAELNEQMTKKRREERAPRPFIPNKHIAVIEKAWLAERMWHQDYVYHNHNKRFLDPRHTEIWQVIQNHKNKYIGIKVLVQLLEQCGSLEKCGGEKFVKDIFEGLPEE